MKITKVDVFAADFPFKKDKDNTSAISLGTWNTCLFVLVKVHTDEGIEIRVGQRVTGHLDIGPEESDIFDGPHETDARRVGRFQRFLGREGIRQGGFLPEGIGLCFQGVGGNPEGIRPCQEGV